MANLISRTSGNFTSSSTWGVVDTTSLNDTEAANTALTTSYQESAAFTPGAITIGGIAVKVASRAAGSPSNTITVRLAQGGSDVSGTPVTMNVSDIDACAAATDEGGWYFFAFGSPVTLSAATAYTVSAKLSATTTVVNLFATSAHDWARLVCTTTTGAPASGSILYVMGDNTGAGTGNSYTVTMNDTSSTVYGSVTSPYNTLPSLSICKKGTLSYGTSASTTYQLNIKGITRIFSSGTLNIGTSGTRMPASSKGQFNITPTANVDSGLLVANNGTLNAYGDNTYGNTVACHLNADMSASATSLTTDVSTGWQIGDSIAIASTSQTATQAEKVTLTGVSGTTLSWSGGTANAHSGTSPTQAEIINLTRNVIFQGSSDTIQGYLFFDTGAIVNMSYYECYRLGSATAGKTGVNVATTTGTVALDHGSHHDFIVASSIGLNVTTTGTSANPSLSYMVFYNTAGTGINKNNFSATVSTFTWDHVWVMKAGSTGIMMTDSGGTYTNIVICSCSSVGMTWSSVLTVNSVNGLTTHSNTTIGMTIGINSSSPATISLSNLVSWRNTTTGISLSARNMNIATISAFGNGTNNILLTGAGNLSMDSLTLSGDSTFASPVGVAFGNAVVSPVYVTNSTFGVASGIFVAHTTADFASSSAGVADVKILLANCALASSTEVSLSNLTTLQSYIASQKDDQTAGNHRFWTVFGTGAIDTTFFNNASPSLRLTPNNASNKMISAPLEKGMQAAVASGGTITAAVYIRKSAAGDGAAYTGNQPRLIVRKNVAAGISSDTVLATYSSSTGAWNQISGTTGAVTDDAVLEFIVDCDGTAGWINIDDWTAS